MKILELFCGTKSFSNVAKELGHEIFTVDIEQKFNPDLCKDIMELNIDDIPFKPDMIWASPPCQSFSVATIGKNWNKDYTPKTNNALKSILLVEKTVDIIKELDPKYYIIENPRGMLRKMPIMKDIPKTDVCYCQYGDTRMKPTDLWNNFNFIGRMCKNGNKDHISAPRGSRTGTQGLKDAVERGIIPRQLCLEVLDHVRDK